MWIKDGSNSLTIDGLPVQPIELFLMIYTKSVTKITLLITFQSQKNNLTNYQAWTGATSAKGALLQALLVTHMQGLKPKL